MDDGLLYEAFGTVVVKSSMTFWSNEKAGLTGYSSSVITTAIKRSIGGR